MPTMAPTSWSTSGVTSLADEFRKMNQEMEVKDVVTIMRQGVKPVSGEAASHPADEGRPAETRGGAKREFAIYTPPARTAPRRRFDRDRIRVEEFEAALAAARAIAGESGDEEAVENQKDNFEHTPPPGLEESRRKRRVALRGRSHTRRGKRPEWKRWSWRMRW